MSDVHSNCFIYPRFSYSSFSQRLADYHAEFRTDVVSSDFIIFQRNSAIYSTEICENKKWHLNRDLSRALDVLKDTNELKLSNKKSGLEDESCIW